MSVIYELISILRISIIPIGVTLRCIICLIEIIYNERQHELNKSNIIRYIDMINNTNYEKNDNYKYELIKNDKHCSFCEFNKLCNRQDVVYSMLEEDIYEC